MRLTDTKNTHINPHATIALDFDVHITETILDALDPKGEANELSFTDFQNNYQTEIKFAQMVLKQAPIGAQLHAHFKGKQLKYICRQTQEAISLHHTYQKIRTDLICVKLIRSCILGVGAYGKVKLLFDIENGNRIAAKELRPINPNDTEDALTLAIHVYNLTREFNGAISSGVINRQRNPIKRVHPEEPQQFGNINLHFPANPNQTPTKPNDNKTTKPFLYYEYRGEDLYRFAIEHKKLRITDILQLPLLFQKLLFKLRQFHEAHLIHADIKPENILILRDEKTRELTPNFCDFDFALKTEAGKNYAITNLKGTLNYLAPELLLYFKATDQIFRQSPFLSRRRQTLINKENLNPNYQRPFEQGGNYLARLSYSTDIYALGTTLTLFSASTAIRNLLKVSTKAVAKKINETKTILSLMTHPQERGRPSLLLTQLALLPLQDIPKESLPSILNEFQLPAISFENATALSNCMIVIASHFTPEAPHPPSLLPKLYQYLTNQFINEQQQPNGAALFVTFICRLYYFAPNKNAEIKDFNKIREIFFITPVEFYKTIDLFKELQLPLDTSIFEPQDLFLKITGGLFTAKTIQNQHQGNTYPSLITTLYNAMITSIKQYDANITLEKTTWCLDTISRINNGECVWRIALDAAMQKNSFISAILSTKAAQEYTAKISSETQHAFICEAANTQDLTTLALLTQHALIEGPVFKNSFFPTPFNNDEGMTRFRRNFFMTSVIKHIAIKIKQLETPPKHLENDLHKLNQYLETIKTNDHSNYDHVADPEDQSINNIIRALQYKCKNGLFTLAHYLELTNTFQPNTEPSRTIANHP